MVYPTSNTMGKQNIAGKIIELKNADLALRDKLLKSGQLSDSYNEEMQKLHNSNAKTLSELIETIGYPTIGKVGKEASEAAWLIIQHSIGDPIFMRRSAELLRIAVDANEADPINLAYLTDRIAAFENRPQLYGTQFDWDEKGNLTPNLFDDLRRVNDRRKSIGLNSLEEQTQLMQKRVVEEKQMPHVDFEKRKIALEEWKKSVGWTK